MVTVDFFGKKVSKLIVGDNPMTGHSYIEDVTTGAEMKQYYTAENIKAAFRHIEELGITTMLPLADPYIVRLLEEHQYEGGNLQFIWQPYMPLRQQVSMWQIQALNTIGIYHQGTTTDMLYKEGKIDEIKENIKMWREGLGVPVGLASHQPEVIQRCEEENWGADFYLASLQNGDRWRDGVKSGFITGETKAHIVFSPDDRPVMLETLKHIDKPIIAYKIFAGGQIFLGKTEEQKRETVKAVYEEVFSALKPNDMAAIGIFQRDKDELKENVEIFNEWYNSKNQK